MGLFGKLFGTTTKKIVNKLENSYMDCPMCGGRAEYNIDTDEFICKECGTNALEYDEDEYDEYDEDDIPEGCAACGGPYPSCTSSCKLFDD